MPVPNQTEIVAQVLDEYGTQFHKILTLSGLDAETYGVVIQFGEVCALAGVSAGIEACQELLTEHKGAS